MVLESPDSNEPAVGLDAEFFVPELPANYIVEDSLIEDANALKGEGNYDFD